MKQSPAVRTRHTAAPTGAPPARRIRAVHRRLVGEQGPPTPKARLPIIDELVMTVLSQHTSDVNTTRAFGALKDAFPRWVDVVAAPTSVVVAAIRPGGLAAQKGPRIQAILAEVERREGAVDLARLNELPDEEVVAYLRSLPGVGPKTAACVLVFSMGRAAFPVDTHVRRIAVRLGWVRSNASAQRAHEELEPRIPPDLRYPLHMAFIRHGREVCSARAPRCSQCVLLDLCEAGPKLLAAGNAV